MIIVDTSVWIDHFRAPDINLANLIAEGDIGLHPFVLGELLLGGLPAAGEVSRLLDQLAQPPMASVQETAAFIAWGRLAGTGIGYVDVSLLVSAKLLGTGTVLTKDKWLHAQANRLALAYTA